MDTHYQRLNELKRVLFLKREGISMALLMAQFGVHRVTLWRDLKRLGATHERGYWKLRPSSQDVALAEAVLRAWKN